MKQEEKQEKRDHSSLLLILVFFVGLSVLLYPSISDHVNDLHQTQAIVDYESHRQGMSDEEYEALFAAAQDYNRQIAQIPYPFMYFDKVEGYEEALDVNGTGVMGYIAIQKIGVMLPIYHGVSPGVLNVAVGHIPGSSLPTGGPGNHTVLSAHRGIPSAKLFSDLDDLQEGDTFTLTVLNRELTYTVDQILIVEPEQVDDLYVQEGKDYCTLVTCTPYGVNSHRLLVRGTRTETPQQEQQAIVSADAKQVSTLLVASLLAAAMLSVLFLIFLLKPRKRK